MSIINSSPTWPDQRKYIRRPIHAARGKGRFRSVSGVICTRYQRDGLRDPTEPIRVGPKKALIFLGSPVSSTGSHSFFLSVVL